MSSLRKSSFNPLITLISFCIMTGFANVSYSQTPVQNFRENLIAVCNLTSVFSEPVQAEFLSFAANVQWSRRVRLSDDGTNILSEDVSVSGFWSDIGGNSRTVDDLLEDDVATLTNLSITMHDAGFGGGIIDPKALFSFSARVSGEREPHGGDQNMDRQGENSQRDVFLVPRQVGAFSGTYTCSVERTFNWFYPQL